jgi:alpha-beta hydrolase superfamily lysophospholipase
MLHKGKSKRRNPYPSVNFNNLSYNQHLEAVRQEFSPAPLETNQSIWKFKSITGPNLFVREWSHKNTQDVKGIVCVFHGFCGHSEYYVLLADQLVQYGFKVMSFDYPGHGLSEGEPRGDVKSFMNILKDARQFMAIIQEKNPNIPIILCGESMGGTVLANLFVYDLISIPIKGALFFAPGVKLKASQASLKDVLKMLKSLLIYPFRSSYPSFYARNQNNPIGPDRQKLMHPAHFEYDRTNPLHLDYVSMRYMLQLNQGFNKALSHAPQKINSPTMIVYGTYDIAIDQKGVELFYARIQSAEKELVLVEGAPHAVFTSPKFQPYWSKVIEWVQNRCKA